MLFKSQLLASVALALSSVKAAYPFDETTISAPDGSVKAKFVPFGATLTELWVKDKRGSLKDIVPGYDDNSRLLSDPDHPTFNAIVGRYANRIKNGSFSIPITKEQQPPGPNVYQIPLNDGGGKVTLAGGIYGWDRRNWTLVQKSPTSVTFKHIDNEDEQWPGTVTTFATHSVAKGGFLRTSIKAYATEKTPIMLTQHIYWNLDGFDTANATILDHKLRIDGSRVIELDGLGIPTGKFINAKNTFWDFRKERAIGSQWNETVGLCRGECQGYDHCWIFDEPRKPVANSLYSPKSGIKVEVKTDQPGVQVYTSYWLNTPRKKVHGGPTLSYGRFSAVAIEQHGYVDAINTPEWNVDQIHQPGKDYAWNAEYKFSVVK